MSDVFGISSVGGKGTEETEIVKETGRGEEILESYSIWGRPDEAAEVPRGYILRSGISNH